GGGGKQPAAVRRQRAGHQGHVAAQVHRRRGLAGILTLPVQLLLALGLALGALFAQGLEQAHLVLAQLVRARRLAGIVLGLDDRGLGGAMAAGPAVPAVVAHAPDEGAVAAPARGGGGGFAAGQLQQRAVAQVAHEHVAVADECRARARGVVDRLRAVDFGALGALDQLRLAAAGLHRPGIADLAAFALEAVVGAAAVPRPPGLLHRGTDPVRVVHDPVQGQFLGRLGGKRGDEQQQGQRQQTDHGRSAGSGKAGQRTSERAGRYGPNVLLSGWERGPNGSRGDRRPCTHPCSRKLPDRPWNSLYHRCTMPTRDTGHTQGASPPDPGLPATIPPVARAPDERFRPFPGRAVSPARRDRAQSRVAAAVSLSGPCKPTSTKASAGRIPMCTWPAAMIFRACRRRCARSWSHCTWCWSWSWAPGAGSPARIRPW